MAGQVKQSSSDKKIRFYVTGRKLLTFVNLDRLAISRQFCFEVLDNVEALLEVLYNLAREMFGLPPPSSELPSAGTGAKIPNSRRGYSP